MSFEIADRYSIFGPHNGCKGKCEGTGMIPTYLRDVKTLYQLYHWLRLHNESYGFLKLFGAIRRAFKYKELRYINFWWERVKHADLDHFLPCPLCAKDN